MSRHRSPRSDRAARRRTTWAAFQEHVTLAAPTDYFTFDLLANFKADGGVTQGVTIARTHFTVAVSTQPDPGDTFTFGLIRGQGVDVGLNIAGAPVPSVDPYDDWLLWQYRGASINGAGHGEYFPGGSNQQNFDLKAMRRLEELQMTYNMVVQNVTASSPFEVYTFGRILLMLP